MFLPLFVQAVSGESAVTGGLVLTPLLVAMIFASLTSGRVIARRGTYRWALIAGPPVTAVGFLVLGLSGPATSRGWIVFGAVIIGAGCGLLHQNLVLVLQNAIPAGRLGAATGAAQLSRNVGATLGVSLIGALLASRLPAHAQLLGNPSIEDREALAAALRPVFLFGIPLMAAVTVIASGIPHLPLSTDVSHASAIRTDSKVPS
jgi:MFS family permease